MRHLFARFLVFKCGPNSNWKCLAAPWDHEKKQTMAGQVILPKHLALKRERTWNTLTFEPTLRDKWYKKHQEAEWRSRVPLSQNQWHWVSVKWQRIPKGFCAKPSVSVHKVWQEIQEKLCPALLETRTSRTATAPACSPASHIQGLHDFDWCRGEISKPRRCIRSQPLQPARASECVAMWSGYSIG